MNATVAAPAMAADAEVTDVRVGKHGLSTRIVIDLDRPIKAEVFKRFATNLHRRDDWNVL